MNQIEQKIEHHVTALQQHALMQSRNAVAADVLVQECLLHALVKVDRYKAGTSLRAWLFSILHNLNLRHLYKFDASGPLDSRTGTHRPKIIITAMAHISDRKGAMRRAINRADIAKFDRPLPQRLGDIANSSSAPASCQGLASPPIPTGGGVSKQCRPVRCK